MPDVVTTDGDTEKWWIKLLNTAAAVEVVDGITGGGEAEYRVEATPPEPTIQDREPYLNRVLTNPTSQKVLIGTVLIVGALGFLAYARR